MSWARTLVTGSGSLNFRIQIEGFPYEPVTDRAMECVAADGRIRYAGLSSSGIVIKERCDILRAKWEPQGFRVTLVDRKRQWTEAFRLPTGITWLAANCTAADTSASIMSASQFVASDHVYINSEVVTYTSPTTGGGAASIDGLVRGVWQTLPQNHYIADGGRLRYPEITNWPRVREGKRATLWVYGAGDDLTSTSATAGTKIWTGVVSTEPTFDGLSWSFSLDPITRKWDQDVGGDLEDPMDIRGIYYPATAPLTVVVIERNSAFWDAGSAASSCRFQVAGFWETQAEFCAYLTTTLLAQTAGASITQIVSAVPDGDSWALEFESDAVSPLALRASAESAVDLIVGDRPIDLTTDEVPAAETIVASRRYRFGQSGGGFPRATIGSYVPAHPYLSGATYRVPRPNPYGVDPVTNPATRVYLNGPSPLSASIASTQVEWESNGHSDLALSESFTCSVSTVSTASRFIVLDGVRPLRSEIGVASHYSAIGSGNVEIKLGLEYTTGDFGDFITSLTAAVPAGINLGSVPDIRAADFVSTAGGISIASTDIPAAASTNILAQGRTYSIFTGTSFADMVEQECRLLGVFPAYASDGTVTFHRLRLPSPGEVASSTITAADIIAGDGEWFGWEVAPLGMINTVELSTGYDPVEDEYLGTLHRTRDVEAFGRNPDGQVFEIKPKSLDRWQGFNQADVVRQASKVLGVFGAPYAFLTIKVKFSRFAILIGDVIAITWSKIPAGDGTLGVTNRLGIVVGREWDFAEASGKLTILMTDQNIAGYVPATKLSGIAGTTGTTGPFTANANTAYFPSGTTASDHWTAGDLIRLFGHDTTATANNALGTISSVTGNSFTFTTTAAWTYGGVTWVLGARISTAITAASQRKYVYIGNADATVDWSGASAAAFTMGP